MGDYDPEGAMEAYYAEAKRRADDMGLSVVSSGEVRPTNIAPVIAPNAKNREPGAFPMKWGFTHPARDVLIFNTRSETAENKPLFAESAKERRCLIPATNYFEWKKAGKEKIKYAICPKDGPLYMAGLYFRLPSEKLPCFSILTMDASSGLEAIHNRMPVIIPQSGISDWLSIETPFRDAIKPSIVEMNVIPA